MGKAEYGIFNISKNFLGRFDRFTLKIYRFISKLTDLHSGGQIGVWSGGKTGG